MEYYKIEVKKVKTNHQVQVKRTLMNLNYFKVVCKDIIQIFLKRLLQNYIDNKCKIKLYQTNLKKYIH